jgi:ADP-ribose pyrophosphatase YjhB (NUDIX family)
MSEKKTPPWLEWAREIQAMSQTGLAHNPGKYDQERYQRLMEIAAEIVARHSSLPQEHLLETFLRQPGYATPKVDVRGAVVRDGRILLVHESMDQLWCMPGGWADVGECPSRSVEREVWEESGFEVATSRVVGVYDANRGGSPSEFFHAFKVVFLCEITGGEARPSSETLAVDFFDFDNLPPLSSQRTHERHLADVSACLRDPHLPTVFD